MGYKIFWERYGGEFNFRISSAPMISSLLHSCPGFATYWRMNKCCITYLFPNPSWLTLEGFPVTKN